MKNDRYLASRSLAALTLGLLSACGGGSGSSSGSGTMGAGGGAAATPPPPVAQAPKISGPAALNLDQDTTSMSASFRLEDADTPLAQLELGVETSDAALLPLAGVVIEGTGNERTLRVTPASEATGSGTIRLTVRDPGGLTSSLSVEVRVNPVLVSFRQLADRAFRADAAGGLAPVSGITLQADADDDAQAFDALLAEGQP